MSLIDSFAVKPLLAACIGLALALAGMSLYTYKLHADVTAAQAAQSVAEGKATTLAAERDQATTRATEIAGARDGWASVAGARGDLLTACQAEQARVRAAGDRGVANAQAAARDAERTLADFTRRYQVESRKPDCERARNAMAAACPALEDF